MDIRSPKPLKILVVEDDTDNAFVITKMLNLFGHSYVLATDGKDALSNLIENEFDLILMDLQMPGMDGIETARIIRNDEKFLQHSATPIIALTAHAMDMHKQQCIEVGMNDFLSKPIILKSIQRTLEQYAALK